MYVIRWPVWESLSLIWCCVQRWTITDTCQVYDNVTSSSSYRLLYASNIKNELVVNDARTRHIISLLLTIHMEIGVFLYIMGTEKLWISLWMKYEDWHYCIDLSLTNSICCKLWIRKLLSLKNILIDLI